MLTSASAGSCNHAVDLTVDLAVDLVILGGGPAGAACAISFRRNFPQWRVALFEASDYDRPRVGEILPAQALPLLRQLRVALPASLLSPLAAQTISVSWGQADLVEQHQLFSARGAGLHLDRQSFDRALAEAAENCGVHVHRRSGFRAARRDGELWNLDLAGGKTCNARFVVDATGRSAHFARSQGACMRRLDTLTAYSHFCADAAPSEPAMILEACPSGWWYTAPLPHRQRVISYLTDVDLGRNIGLPGAEAWLRLLNRTRHIAAIGKHLEPAITLQVSPASTAVLSTFRSEGWLAAGDAAATCDPLAGQGITKALHEGILASYAAADYFASPATPDSGRYQSILTARFEGYRRVHRLHHAREMRWPHLPFWQRRQVYATHHEIHGDPARVLFNNT
jgi:flavin-dependent dehydrogenase